MQFNMINKWFQSIVKWKQNCVKFLKEKNLQNYNTKIIYEFLSK